MFNSWRVRFILAVVCIVWISLSLGSIVRDPKQHFFDRYYTEEYYLQLQKLYGQSQYRQKNPSSVIADDVVFRYAAGAYVRGVDPILINSEITPLGKYIVGLSFLLWQNDGVVILFFGIVSLGAMWMLGKLVLDDWVLALLPTALFSTEELFRNQFRVTPLMDIIQLSFILLALVCFLKEWKKGRFFFTSLMLGFVMATKSIIPAALLTFTFVIFLLILKRLKEVVKLSAWLTLSIVVLAVSYTRTFQDGYNFFDFLKFQKWILLYQQSKLIFPFSFWRLALFNQWQTWWGEQKILEAVDWWPTWPVLVLTPLFALILHFRKTAKLNNESWLILLWSLVYEIFLSIGVVTTRFLLPLLPALYILAFFVGRKIIKNKFQRL